MIAYLGFLLVLGAWGIGNWSLLWRGLAIGAIYTALDLAIASWRERKFILPTSGWISALILAFVLSPTAPWSAVVLAPVLASLSKHVLRYKRKHVLNPAAFALVATSVLFQDVGIVSWWGAAWGTIPLIIIVLSGIVTAFRVKRWKTALVFLLLYFAGTAALLGARGGGLMDIRTIILDGTVWFFATVMLIEPVTTAYQPAWLRTVFGAEVTVLTLLFSLWGSALSILDPFLAALLMSNITTRVASRWIRGR